MTGKTKKEESDMLQKLTHSVNSAEKLGPWGGGIVYHLPDDLGP